MSVTDLIRKTGKVRNDWIMTAERTKKRMITPRNVHQEGQVIVQSYNEQKRRARRILAVLACDHYALQRLGKTGLRYINTLILGS